MSCIALLLTLTTTPSAHADPSDYYAKHARAVAKDMGCSKTFEVAEVPGNDAKAYYTGGACRTGQANLLVVTFRGPTQQAGYKASLTGFIQSIYPPGDYFFASDKGAMVFSKGFNYRAALIGKRRLGASITTVHVK